MPRSSAIYYISPSNISITPNANGRADDLAVYVARGTKVKVYYPPIDGLHTDDASYREWTLRGRNRRLTYSDKTYTIYARLSKTDQNDAYIVFVPKVRESAAVDWSDHYVLSPNTSSSESMYTADRRGGEYLWAPIPEAQARNNRQNYWWVKIGEVSLPVGGERSVTIDTGILGTDQFNSEWELYPDPLERGLFELGRRYHWYDRVSWLGSIWLCLVPDEYVWEDAEGNAYDAETVTGIIGGEGSFTYHVSGLPGMETGQEITGQDHYYSRGTSGGTTVYLVKRYTYSAPSDDTSLWLKEVSKGTEITGSVIHYAASLDGVNHPSDEYDGGSTDTDPSTVVVPDSAKQRTTTLLSSFASTGVSVPAGTKTHAYLSKIYYEAECQFSGQSAFGLPLLYSKTLFPTLTDHYGTGEDASGALAALTGWAFASVLAELRPDKRNALMACGYNLGPDKDTDIYKNKFEHDQNVARLVGSAVVSAMRGLLSQDMDELRTELGGQKLTIKISDVAPAPYATYKDTYYLGLQAFMPSAPGPYAPGYTDRSSGGGIPYPTVTKTSDGNLPKDKAAYDLVVSSYNFSNTANRQRTVQAIADKSGEVQHLFGPNRSSGDYSFHPVFGTDTIGLEISTAGATASAVEDIFEVGIGSRQALKQGAWDGRLRPGQENDSDHHSKTGAAGVLYNYIIDNIDGTPVTDYDSAGAYNTAQNGNVYPNSYPSGHSSGIWATAMFLMEIMPGKADLIMRAANDFALSRQICRYHWLSDTIVGRLAGAAIAPVMRASADYSSLLLAARGEIYQGGGWKKTIAETGILPGQYLWTRRKTYYSDSREPTAEYSVARWGIDGDGIAEVDSFYLGTPNTDLVITADNDNYPMPGSSGWASADPKMKWFNTFGEMETANGGVGQMQGWNVWEKTVVKYDLANNPDGTPRTEPDLVNYQCNRIGIDGMIAEEEYYLLAESDDFATVFGSLTPSKNKIGILWQNQGDPAAENYRLRTATASQANINTAGASGFSASAPVWSAIRPNFETGSAKKYLWNFEQSADGQGSEYATRPICIGDASRGIAGVIELYALSASQTPISADRPIPADINAKNTFGVIPTSGFDDKQVWADESYERAPKDGTLPYQWNWTRTLYTSTKNAADTARYTYNGVSYPYEDHYHVSAVKGSAGEDGAGTEYIYCCPESHDADGTPIVVEVPDPKVLKDKDGTARTADYIKTHDDFIPYEWTDNPTGIDSRHQIEYQAERKSSAVMSADGFTSGHEWGQFSDPKPWSKWGERGEDGDGVEYVFIRTTSNVAPTIVAQTDTYTDSAGRTYKDDDFLPQAKGGSLSGNVECTDNPTGTDLTNKFEWVAMRKKSAPASGTGIRQWNKYSGAMALWSNFAENSVRIDLDNEADMVQTDSAGKVKAPRTVTTRARIYDGASPATTGVTQVSTASGMNIGGCTPSVSLSSGVLTVTWSFTTAHTISTTADVTITLKFNNTDYQAVFTLTPSLNGAIFQLKPSLTVIGFTRNRDNTMSPESYTLAMSVVKIDGASTSELTVAASGQTVRYSTSSMPASATAGQAWPAAGLTVANSATYTEVYVAMFNASGTLLDRETIPIVKDGNGGYRVFLTTPTPPYDPGDMWVNAVWPPTGQANAGSLYNNDLLKCKPGCGVPRDGHTTFSIDDWDLASKYTDDTYAHEFDYLSAAMKGDTSIQGGLLLSNTIVLRNVSGTTVTDIMSGINGVLNTSIQNPLKSIAAWYGGDMADKENPSYNQSTRYAKSLFRMDGSGYVASGNISWDASGNPTIKGQTITAVDKLFIGETEVKLDNFVTISTVQTITGLKTFTSLLTASGNIATGTGNGSYIKIGSLYLSYDSANNALRVSANADGTGAANFYAMGGVSALGAGSGGSSGGMDVNAMWSALATNDSSKQIHQSHISSALGSYATQSWVLSQIGGTTGSYLPLSGGTMTGSIFLPSSYVVIGASTGEQGKNLYVNGDAKVTGTIYMGSATVATQTWVGNQGYLTQHQSLSGYATETWVNTQLTGYLPLTGGLLTRNSDTPLDLKGNGTSTFLGFQDSSGTRLGFIGFNASKQPVVYESGTSKKIWYEGNFNPSNYLPTTGANYNTKTDANPFIISRLGNTAEAIAVKVNDSRTLFEYTNDERDSAIHFTLINTDLESGGGTYASTRTMSLASGYSGMTLSIDGDTVATQTWVHSNYLPLSGGTISGGITLSQNAGGILTADSQGIYIQKGTHWLRATANGCDCDGYAIITSNNIGSQSVSYATTAGSAPASDVYAWAKAATKPSYNLDEVGDGSTRKLSNYLPLAGGTMTGAITLQLSAYYTDNKCGLNCNNSDIIGVNSIYTNDVCDSWSESIQFKRTNGNWDSFRAKDDVFYFGTNSGTERVWLNAAIGSADLGLTLQGANYTMTLCIGNGGTNRGIWGVTSGKWLLYFNSANTILNYGKVGIGTTDPSYKLHVSGDIYATGGVTCLSDARKKDVVCDLPITVDEIANAPAIRFLWKDERKVGYQAGTLAQYWQKVLPEVITDKSGELSMQYGVTALVSVIKTARKVVDHEARIKELEAECERLRNEVKQLKKV